MRMIDTIEIKNFKSIRHQKIEGCKRVNVFIGYPNVGKSNILEAMSLAASEFNNSGKPLTLKDLCRFEETIGLFNDGNKQKKIEVLIDNFVYLLEFFDPNTILYDVVEMGLLSAIKPGDTSISSKRLTINQSGIFGQTSIHTGRKQPEIKIKKYQFKELQNSVRNNPLVLDFPFGSNLFEVLRYNGDLRKQCGELFSDYELKLAFDEDAKLKIQKQLDEYSVFGIPMLQVSDTLQRLIFHKAAIATNQGTVLLFEEPEAHMFPPYISKFTGDVIYDKNSNQFFIATHSPFVLNDFMEDMDKNDLSIYAVGYTNGETTINRLTDKQVTDVYQYGVDLFFNLEDFLKDVVS
jgi:AAA15 family ATPase/GTPase